jgi:phosphatidate cytidylyltransferase
MVMTLLSLILITKNVERDMPKVVNTVFPFVYLTALGTFFILLRKLPQGNYWIFSLVMLTWIYDAGAYFTGVAFGRHKLIAELSPKKSVEGFIGGIVVNIAAAAILRLIIFKEFFHSFPMAHIMILAVLLSFTGQAGDIAESVIKRYTGVKNSSNLLPEMGGVMDKIDSLLFNAPVLYLYIKLFIIK